VHFGEVFKHHGTAALASDRRRRDVEEALARRRLNHGAHRSTLDQATTDDTVHLVVLHHLNEGVPDDLLLRKLQTAQLHLIHERDRAVPVRHHNAVAHAR
jgi:hypothetical protein